MALIGPPASGKSTVSRVMRQRLGAQEFRLREHAAAVRAARPDLAHLLARTDALGWYADATVAVLLGAAFATGRKLPRWVVLENLPGNTTQLRVLRRLTSMIAADLLVVELIAADAVVQARAAARRACLGCEPDPLGDPHPPATAAPNDPTRCAKCATPLIVRRRDSPATLSIRLRRYRANLLSVRATAAAGGLAHVRVDATFPAAAVAEQVVAVCQEGAAVSTAGRDRVTLNSATAGIVRRTETSFLPTT